MTFQGTASKEKLLYLMSFLDHYIEQNVYDILNDDPKDPEYSAVSVTNLIKCYRDIMLELNGNCYFKDVPDYFSAKMLDNEYPTFETSRIKESVYYVGKQY